MKERESVFTFTLNTDGVPVFKSSGYQFWPLYLVINELPYQMRYFNYVSGRMFKNNDIIVFFKVQKGVSHFRWSLVWHVKTKYVSIFTATSLHVEEIV